MDERTQAFIDAVRTRKALSFDEAERIFAISRRTVYNYVRRANEALQDAEIVIDRGRLVYRATDSLQAAEETNHAEVPTDHAGRVAFLLRNLLAREDWVTIDELAAQLFITRRTISSDLRDVEQELARFDLTLEKRPRYGLRVNGPEMMRRLCLVQALDEAASSGQALTLDVFADDADIAPAVTACVNAVLEETGFSINTLALQSLLVHIAVTVLRARRGASVAIDASRLEQIVTSHEYPVAESIAQALSQELHVALPVEEVAYIAIHLAGRQSLYDVGDADVLISDEVWDVVQRMLARMFEAYRVDFSGDLELRMNLARHVAPLAVRLRYHMRLDNPLLDDVRSRFPLAFSMAADASAVLAEQYGESPSDEEIGYLAMAFILALDRKDSGIAKKRVLVVCASGASTARLLKDRYEREFAECIDKLDVCDVIGVSSIDWTTYDYVFTTVPLPITPPIPVRAVGDIFDPAETDALRTALRRGDSAVRLRELFDERLFFTHVCAATKDEVLRMLCQAAIQAYDLTNDFAELVFRREEIAPTAFGNSVAMPHPAQAITEHTFVAVALLDKPVAWNERVSAVRAIFLVSPARTGGRELNAMFGMLAELFSSAELMERLISDQRWKTLMEVLGVVGG